MTFLLSPLSLPHIVLGFSLLFFLSLFGLGISFTSLVIGHTVVSLPYIVRTVAGVYRSVPPNLEESAFVLGASRWQVFWRVTFPVIRPGVFAGCLLAVLLSLDNLSVSLFFGGPRTNTLPIVMLSYLETQFDPSIAAASTIQLAVALLVLTVVERFYGLRSLSV
jgi:putative spermidine/putrescine transport system permease protein